MNEISGEELKAKIDRGDEFRLVMTLVDLAFRGKHISGSIDLHEPEPFCLNPIRRNTLWFIARIDCVRPV